MARCARATLFDAPAPAADEVSSEADYDWLEFYINGVRQDRISGTVNWQQKSYALTSGGPHSLMWQGCPHVPRKTVDRGMVQTSKELLFGTITG